MKPLSTKTRFAIYERDDFTCAYCLWRPETLYRKTGRGERIILHVDHIFPRALGGTDDPWNLVTACEGCNLEKGTRIWRPQRLICSFCKEIRVVDTHAELDISLAGAWLFCGSCSDRAKAEYADFEAAESYAHSLTFDDITPEVAYYDSLISEGWDVAA